MSSVKQDKRSLTAIFLPLFGLAVIGISLAVSYVLSEPLYGVLADNFSQLPSLNEQPEMQIATGFGIFLCIVMLMALVFAVFAPKPKARVSEASLQKEKEARKREALERDRRRKQMRAQIRKQNERQG